MLLALSWAHDMYAYQWHLCSSILYIHFLNILQNSWTHNCLPQSFTQSNSGSTVLDWLLSQLWRLHRKSYERLHLKKCWSSSRSSPLLSHLLSWLASHLPSSCPFSSNPNLCWSLPHRLLLRLLQPVDHRLRLRDRWEGKQGGRHLLVQLPGEQRW